MTPKEYAGVYHLAVAAEHRLSDNIANSVTHDIGAVLAITGAVVLVITSIGGTGLAETSADVFSNAGWK